jgi:integrase
MYDFDCPTPSTSWRLDWTLWGIKRDLRNPVIPKKPITPEILLRLISFPTDMYHPPATLSWEKQVLFATVQITYIIAFFSMLRASNLLPASLSVVDPERQMVWGRLISFEGGVVLVVVLSKTIQCRERRHEIALAERTGSPFCPVAAVRRLLALRNGQKCGDNELLLQIPVNSIWRPLCKDTVITVMRSQLKKLGLDPQRYSFHSFRHGSIQTAVLAQPALELIKLQSGHLSDAVHLYTQMPGSARMVTTAKMLEQMDGFRASVVPASL